MKNLIKAVILVSVFILSGEPVDAATLADETHPACMAQWVILAQVKEAQADWVKLSKDDQLALTTYALGKCDQMAQVSLNPDVLMRTTINAFRSFADFSAVQAELNALKAHLSSLPDGDEIDF